MDYEELSQEQLLSRIQELKILNRQLLEEKEQETRLEYAWTGNLGHWYWNIKTNAVTFNPLKITTLGYDKSEIPERVTYQYFTEKLHPDDYQIAMEAMLNHLYHGAEVYETEYRILAKDGTYRWYYDRGRITQYDEQGQPLFLAGIVFDITEKKETQLELEQKNRILAEMSYIDGLTKISNHRTLIEQLETELVEANRMGKALSIALFDIDDFKKVNDTRGHVFGDQVLVDIAAIIQDNTRDSDLAGRYGGEEFMVIFSGADLAIASSIAERIRMAVEAFLFAEEARVTISGGVAQYCGQSLSDFIQAADENLYRAKRDGKNRIES